MSLFIASLNSGSNGNCYYVGNHTDAILVDVGISCKEVEKRMHRLQLDIKKLKAIFVTHEHSDHIKGIDVLAKKYNLPVYITPGTLQHHRLPINKKIAVEFSIYEKINVGNLSVSAFSKQHDACDPCSFTVSYNGTVVGIFTDIGTPCTNLVSHFKQCHAAFLEANYDEEMLSNGSYPYHLKQRISGGKGHLSNRQALEIFTTHQPPQMSHLLLAHLSRNNNCPELVSELFNEHANGVQIVVASRYEESAVYEINGNVTTSTESKLIIKQKSTAQLAFAF